MNAVTGRREHVVGRIHIDMRVRKMVYINMARVIFIYMMIGLNPKF
jgi:hypothetical protein